MPRRRVDPFDDYDSLSAVDSDADNELDVFDKYPTARTPDIESKRKSTNRCSKPVARLVEFDPSNWNTPFSQVANAPLE